MQEKPETPQIKGFDVEEADREVVEKQLVYAGEIREWWKQDQKSIEKAKARPFIATVVIVIWVLVLVATAIRSFVTGDFLILIPPTIISIPLTIILQFYFKEDKKQ